MNELEKVNQFTKKELSEDEVFLFDAVLCDNDIDRDYECFSDMALSQLQALFIGKTGIFDHDLRSNSQTARIYDTEIVRDDSKFTKDGRPYIYLKAHAYMVRTDDNSSLIREIEGGIKKEISISCSVRKRICSICGSEGFCGHTVGDVYDGILCHKILDDVQDAYEWSFVTVPAQVRAGVTKQFDNSFEPVTTEIDSVLHDVEMMLRKDVLSLCGRSSPVSKALRLASEKMNVRELMAFREELMAEQALEPVVQIAGGDFLTDDFQQKCSQRSDFS
ncbi:MAG TPA: hypothetical protein DCO72_02645 [Ruminococcus sp.]|nr:hypothetical protein [Ruminococcus sp.]